MKFQATRTHFLSVLSHVFVTVAVVVAEGRGGSYRSNSSRKVLPMPHLLKRLYLGFFFRSDLDNALQRHREMMEV